MIKLFLFGPPRLEREGQPLPLHHRKAWGLLAYLAVTNQLQSRDTLASLLWPDQPQTKARANLRRELTRLRKLVGSDQFVADRETIILNEAAGLWVDVLDFQQQLVQAQQCPHSAAACETCLPLLSTAAETYTADFLAGFSLPDSLTFEEWQLFQTESLRQDLSRTLEHLVQGYQDTAQFDQAISQAHRWLALDSFHETPHQQLMILYDHTGQQAAALRQYELCMSILAEEFGVAPQPETTALYEEIRARAGPSENESSDSGWREKLRETQAANRINSPFLPDGFETPKHNNLPTSLTPFIGRATDLAALKAQLQDPACRLLTLLGPGGSGKTRLAQEAAAAELDHYAHGVCFVPLAPLEAVETIVSAIAEALGFAFHGGGEPEQQLLTYLRQKEMLLILDNFEHLLAEVGLVTQILQKAPSVKIVTTSRAKLKIQSEHLFHVSGMDFPATESQQETTTYSAVKLFLSSLNRVRPEREGGTPTTDELADIAEICRLVRGMPLAVLLAAGWGAVLTPAEIVAEIGRSLDFLTTDMADIPDRQRSMRVVFDHSWKLLTEREQAVFRAVAVFRGGFSHEALQAVTGASLPELMTFVNKSLLHRLPNGRYEVHELLRQYVAEKLAERGPEKAAIQQKHSDYYVGFLIQQQSALEEDQPDKQVLSLVDGEIENIRVAWQWLYSHGELKTIEDFVVCVWLFYKHKTWYREALSILQQVCRLEASSPQVSVRWYNWLAEAQWGLGQTVEAYQQTQHALRLLNQPLSDNLIWFTVRLLRQLGRDALRTWRPQPAPSKVDYADPNQGIVLEATRLYLKATRLSFMNNQNISSISYVMYGLDVAEPGGPSNELALVYAYWANAIDVFSLYRSGEFYAVQSEKIARQLGNGSVLIEVSFLVGLHYLTSAKLDKAKAILNQGLAVAQQQEEWQPWGEIASFLGGLYFWQGDFARMTANYEQLYQVGMQFHNRSLEEIALNWQGRNRLRLGQIEEAIALLVRASTIYPPDEKVPLWEFLNQGWLALCYLSQGDLTRAEQIAAKVLDALAPSLIPSYLSIESAAAVARVYLTLWEMTMAANEDVLEPNLPSLKILQTQARRACQILRRLAWIYPVGQSSALLYRGWYHSLLGQSRKARQLWHKGIKIAEQVNMPYYEGLLHYEIGRHLLPHKKKSPEHHVHLTRAQEIFIELEATYDLARVQAELT